MSPKMRDALKAVVPINTKLPIGTVVEEECCEFLQEICKFRRHKGSTEHLVEEACDVLTSVYVLLFTKGISEIEIEKRIMDKCQRAVTRYEEKGEV